MHIIYYFAPVNHRGTQKQQPFSCNEIKYDFFSCPYDVSKNFLTHKIAYTFENNLYCELI